MKENAWVEYIGNKNFRRILSFKFGDSIISIETFSKAKAKNPQEYLRSIRTYVLKFNDLKKQHGDRTVCVLAASSDK